MKRAFLLIFFPLIAFAQSYNEGGGLFVIRPKTGTSGFLVRNGTPPQSGTLSPATASDTAYFQSALRLDKDLLLGGISPDSVTLYKSKMGNTGMVGLWWRNSLTNRIHFIRTDTTGIQFWTHEASQNRFLMNAIFGSFGSGVGNELADYLIIRGTTVYPYALQPLTRGAMLTIISDLTSAASNQSLIWGKQQGASGGRLENFMILSNPSDVERFKIDSIGGVYINTPSVTSTFFRLSNTATTNVFTLYNDNTATNGGIQMILRNQEGTIKLLLDGRQGQNSYINNGGNIGFGTPTPRHKSSSASSFATNLNAFNVYNSDKNLDVTTAAQERDSSSVAAWFSGAGTPTFRIVNALGATQFQSDSMGITVGTVVRDTTSFATTATRTAVYIAGATSTDQYVASPRAVDAEILPTSNDVILAYAKADSVIFTRPASGISGLKFSFVRLK